MTEVGKSIVVFQNGAYRAGRVDAVRGDVLAVSGLFKHGEARDIDAHSVLFTGGKAQAVWLVASLNEMAEKRSVEWSNRYVQYAKENEAIRNAIIDKASRI